MSPRTTGRQGLDLASPNSPRRRAPRVLGRAHDTSGDLIGQPVPDARYHFHVQGLTGVGKSTWLAGYVLGEARAGRGVALIDFKGDLARDVLDRLPDYCARRLVIIDPADQDAPPAYNPLAVDEDPAAARVGQGQEWAAEQVTGVMRSLYAAWWGPRMDDLMRGVCLTLVAARPGATLLDALALLTDASIRRAVLARGVPEGLETLWNDFDALTPALRQTLCAPLVSRLRGVLARPYVRDLLGAAGTFSLTDVLDGGVLIARLPKGELGDDAARLVGSLLLAGLWAHTTRRSARAPQDRPDASIVIDEAQNAMHVPIGLDEALAESRGYRVSWVLAHQHLAQLPGPVADAIDANARNKIVFQVSPKDAAKLAPHFRPYLSEWDLAGRDAYEISARTVQDGRTLPPYTLASVPLEPPIAGRADQLRAAARDRTGLTPAERRARRQQSTHDRATERSPLRPPKARPQRSPSHPTSLTQLPAWNPTPAPQQPDDDLF